MKSFWSKVGARDLFIGIGVLLSAIGGWMVYPPAAFIGAGLVSLSIGLFGVPKWK